MTRFDPNTVDRVTMAAAPTRRGCYARSIRANCSQAEILLHEDLDVLE